MAQSIFYFSTVIIATIVGGIGPLYFGFIRKRLDIGLYFSSGILVGASFLHLIPEAFEDLGSFAGTTILFGFLILFLLEKFFLLVKLEIWTGGWQPGSHGGTQNQYF